MNNLKNANASSGFIHAVQERFPLFFSNVITLNVGALTLPEGRNLFDAPSAYWGADVAPGPGVNLVIDTPANIDFPDSYFDTVISVGFLHRDKNHTASLKNMVRMLRPGGLLTLACASTGSSRLSVQNTDDNRDAESKTANNDVEGTYWSPLIGTDLSRDLSLSVDFAAWQMYYNAAVHELYFVGVLNGTAFSNMPLLSPFRCEILGSNDCRIVSSSPAMGPTVQAATTAGQHGWTSDSSFRYFLGGVAVTIALLVLLCCCKRSICCCCP